MAISLRGTRVSRVAVVCGLAVAFATAGLGASVAQASAPPPTGCKPTACTPGATVGLTNGQGKAHPRRGGSLWLGGRNHARRLRSGW